MFSRFFIDRPIFAAVISVFFVLAGLAAMRSLPIAQYPEIAPPVVTVQAVYPGASADVLEQTVAAPLENAINGVQGMIYMNSHSTAQGVTQIAVTFEIGTNVDDATINVNNRVKQVEPRLPLEVRRQGVSVERGSSSFLQVLAFYSPDGRYDDLFTSNYVTLNVLDELKRLPGTTNVQIFGAKDYAMRIWLLPDRLAQLKLTPGRRRRRDQRAERAVRRRQGRPVADRRQAGPRLHDHDAAAGSPTRRSSARSSSARIPTARRCACPTSRASSWGRRTTTSSAATTATRPRSSASSSRPGANALEVAKTVRDRAAALAQKFPEGLTYAIPYDTTRFVEVSITEVVKTLAEAMLLVFLVVYLFLQSWRAAVIPFIAVPVSLIGTFAGLYALGYSINTLTLFGMVLAIGIVVDDAIVVLENVERNMREDKLAAARRRGQGDARGDGADHRDRADALRRVRADRLPRRTHRRALPAVRGDDLDRGRHLGTRRADAVAGAVRADAEARPSPAGPLLHVVQRLVRPRHAPLFRRRALDDPARIRRRRPVRRHGGDHRLAVEDHAGKPRPRRGPGFLHRRGVPARRRVARAHGQGREAGRGSDPRQPGEPGHRLVHRLRLHRRRLPQQRRHALRRAGAVGEAQGDRGEPRRRALRPDDGHQGGAGARVQSAGDLRPRHDGRVRVLHPEPRRRRLEAARGSHAGVSRAREQRQGAGRRADAVARDRAAALRRHRPREGEEARRADRRRLQRARRHARHLLRQRLQQVRPDVAGADVGRPGVPQAARRHRRRLRAVGEGRDDPAVGARDGQVHVGRPTRSTASTTCRR